MANPRYCLKIDRIEGDCSACGAPGSIGIESWAWGMSFSEWGDAAKLSVDDFAFTFKAGKASRALLLACAQGQLLGQAVLTCGPEREQPALQRIVMSDVIVRKFHSSGGEQGELDSVTLNYSRIEVEYRDRLPNGEFGPVTKSGWDIKRNQKVT